MTINQSIGGLDATVAVNITFLYTSGERQPIETHPPTLPAATMPAFSPDCGYDKQS